MRISWGVGSKIPPYKNVLALHKLALKRSIKPGEDFLGRHVKGPCPQIHTPDDHHDHGERDDGDDNHHDHHDDGGTCMRRCKGEQRKGRGLLLPHFAAWTTFSILFFFNYAFVCICFTLSLQSERAAFSIHYNLLCPCYNLSCKVSFSSPTSQPDQHFKFHKTKKLYETDVKVFCTIKRGGAAEIPKDY